MKKIFSILILTAFCLLFAPDINAQSPTPTVGTDWIMKVINAGALNTTKPTVIVNPFFKDQNVEYIQVIAVYANVTGDSCNLKIYASPDGVNFTKDYINRRTAFQWETGDGTSKTMCDTVTLTRYALGSLKIVCDTLTKMTAGTITVFIKPHFK